MTDSGEFRAEEQEERAEEENYLKANRYEMMLKKASPTANVIEIENDEEEAYESIRDEENLEFRSKINKDNSSENTPNMDNNRQK